MAPSDRPNILVVMADQLRRSALGCYGDGNVKTPNIDRLAAAGVRFEAASSSYPICVPFRFTFMTGQYAHSRRVPAIEWRMAPAERTLADVFNAAGYDTIYVGKWHLYGGHGHGKEFKRVNKTPVPRAHRGRWQRWLGFELANDPEESWYFEDDDPKPRRVKGFQTDGLSDLMMRELGWRDGSRPFLAVLSVEPPHPPLRPPPADWERWRARKIALPPNVRAAKGLTLEAIRQRRRAYYALVENFDRNVGRIAEFLETSGLARRTIVVLVSDHGELGGAHGLVEKSWPFEESIGIPLIVADPRMGGRKGRAIADPVASEDLMPTLIGLAGLAPEAGLPGADLTPLVRSDRTKLQREGVLLEFVADHRPTRPFHRSVWRGFRTARHKYVVRGPDHEGKPWALFDLAEDPYEMRNLVRVSEARELLQRMHVRLGKALRDAGDDYRLSSLE